MEKTTTVRIQSKRLGDFRRAAKGQGFDWRFKLNEVIDNYTRAAKQGPVKAATRSGV